MSCVAWDHDNRAGKNLSSLHADPRLQHLCKRPKQHQQCFLAGNIVGVVWVAYTSVEVEDQREATISFCLRGCRDPKQRKTYRKKQFRFHQSRPPWDLSVFRDSKLLVAIGSEAKVERSGSQLTHFEDVTSCVRRNLQEYQSRTTGQCKPP